MIIVSLLVIFWINLSLNSTQKVMTTTQNVDTVQPGTNPVQYSKDKAEEINKKTIDQAKELNKIP